MSSLAVTYQLHFEHLESKLFLDVYNEYSQLWVKYR